MADGTARLHLPLYEADEVPAPRRPRNRSESIKRIAKSTLRADAAEYAHEIALLSAAAPTMYAQCEAATLGTEETPCPYLRCRWHLMSSASPRTGAVKIVLPDADGVPDLTRGPTCALRVVDENPGGMTLESIAEMLNMTRERVRQIEGTNLRALYGSLDAVGIHCVDDLAPSGEPSKRKPLTRVRGIR